MKIHLLFAFLLASTVAHGGENEFFAAARTGLNLREKPETGAKVLDKIPYGTKVTLIESGGASKRIVTEGFYGNWRKTIFLGKEGYIIDTYLLPFPPPAMNTTTMKNYLAEITKPFGDSLVVDTGNRDSLDDVSTRLIKQLYKNGAERHEYIGYEYNSMTYFIPGLTMQQAFLLIRLLPEFSDYIGEKDEFILSNKKVKKKEREYEYKVEKEVYGDTPWINRIKIGFEEGAIYEFELFQIDNQVVIFYGAGV